MAAFAMAADPPITPLTVCEVLSDLPAHDGKDMAVLGRYSFRANGRWIGEQSCESSPSTAPLLWLAEDGREGPKPPEDFELDARALDRKFAGLTRRTSLGKFRFGSPDYDRWAVIYGRVVARKGEAARKAPADLVFRGDGVVVFLTAEK